MLLCFSEGLVRVAIAHQAIRIVASTWQQRGQRSPPTQRGTDWARAESQTSNPRQLSPGQIYSPSRSTSRSRSPTHDDSWILRLPCDLRSRSSFEDVTVEARSRNHLRLGPAGGARDQDRPLFLSSFFFLCAACSFCFRAQALQMHLCPHDSKI